MSSKICPKCGKTFRTPSNLATHLDRKTPCVILEPEMEHSCEFCNKKYTSKSNLNKHIKNCKLKNTKIDANISSIENKLQKSIEATTKYYPYLTPNLDNFNISEDDLRGASEIPTLLLAKIYFNPDCPSNHTLHISRQSPPVLLYYDGAWKIAHEFTVNDIFENVRDFLKSQIMHKYVNSDGCIADDTNFAKLDSAVRNKIYSYNSHAYEYKFENFIEDLTSRRKITELVAQKLKKEIAEGKLV